MPEDRISAIQHLLASLFASQRVLRNLAPEYQWLDFGNILGDFGELIAIDNYKLTKAPSDATDYDATTEDGKTVQIKTNYAAKEINFSGEADLLLVIGVNDDGTWKEIFYGDFNVFRGKSRILN